MARFARIDSQIRADRQILANRLRVPKLNPFFLRFALRGGGGAKIANRRFEAIRANRSHVMKMRVFLQIDSRESMRCESPGLLRVGHKGRLGGPRFSQILRLKNAKNENLPPPATKRPKKEKWAAHPQFEQITPQNENLIKSLFMIFNSFGPCWTVGR